MSKYDNFGDYRNKIKKIEYNLNHFSLYFNGMYFESIALETFFKLVDDKYDIVGNNKNIISFLPRILFFSNNSKEALSYKENKNGKDFYGYSEIDCVFVLNEKEQVTIEKEKITCFSDFDIDEEILFFNTENFVDLKIEKENVVFMEIILKFTYINSFNYLKI